MTQKNKPLAIVGIGCRLPGDADSPDSFWDLLANGEDGIIEVPKDRWSIERFYDPDPAKKGKTYVKHGGYLTRSMDEMDALFFGISPREAEVLDPQQRLILEVAWEALEDAGLVASELAGSKTGVYIGGFMLDHLASQASILNRHLVGAHSAVSFSQTMLSARLSYTFDFRGPCFTMDTACSSSLVAIDQAAKAMWRNDCNLALVGGVSIMYRAETPMTMAKGQFLSKDGRSKSFDSRGDGYGRGEGAAIVVLKPLDQAEKDGDLIYASIVSTGTNQDGHTDAITVPNPKAQATLIREVMQQADIVPEGISFVEAHGTGTALGDPLECKALSEALETSQDNPVWVGSVKANIGHLEPAAGIAGLIKASLCMSHSAIPPVANLEKPNPNISFDTLGIKLPRKLETLSANHEHYAAINSFGYGGTNAHAIIKNYTASNYQNDQSDSDTHVHALHFLPISAKSDAALKALSANYAAFIDSNRDQSLSDICFSASTRRQHHRHRLGITAASIDTLIKQLNDFSAGNGQYLASGKASVVSRDPVFVMSGMGPQWWAMGQTLLETESIFREIAQRCDKIFYELSGWSILDEMSKDEQNSRMSETHIAQPANFIVQVGLYELLLSKGVKPSAIVGHSVGEVSAAYASGVLSLEDAICVSFHRSRLQKTLAGRGGMLAVALSTKTAEEVVENYSGKVSIAAINSPSSLTLAGDMEALELISKDLTEKNIFNRFLKVELPYHSPLMQELKEDVIKCLGHIKPSLPSTPLYSTVTGKLVDEVLYDADYWYKNIREPVYFSDAITAIANNEHDLFLEVGPHPVLSGSINEVLGQLDIRAQVIPTLNRKQDEQEAFYRIISELYCHGTAPNWSTYYPNGGQFIRLPLYAWQRQKYWSESEVSMFDRLGDPSDHPILGHQQNTPKPTWTQPLNSQYLPWLPDHKVQGLVILPGAAYVEVALQLQKRYLKSSVCTLENIKLQRALVINALEEPVLHTEYDPQKQHFQIFSGKNDSKRWDLHTSGYLSTASPRASARTSLSTLLKECNERLPVETLYARLSKSNLEYDTAFRTIEEVWKGDNEILIKMKAHKNTDLSGYTLHPTLLDASFQSLVGLVDENDNSSFMPVEIAELHFFQSPSETIWAHSRLSAQNDLSMLADIDLFNEEGKTFAEVRGLRCQAVQNSQATNDIDDCFYEIIWQPEAIDQSKDIRTGQWVCFMDHQGVVEKISANLETNKNEKVIRVYTGDKFKKVSNDCFEVRLNNEEDMISLFNIIDANTLQGAIYGWALDLNDSDIDGTIHSMALLKCAKILMTNLQDSQFNVSLHMLSSRAQSLASEQINSGQASVVGLARVIANEYTLRCVLIDYDGELSDKNLDLITQEITIQDDENEVAIYNGERFVYRLKRWQKPEEHLSRKKDDKCAIQLQQKKDQYFWQEYTLVEIEKDQVQVYIEHMVLPKEYRPQQPTLMPIIGSISASKHASYSAGEWVLVFAYTSEVNNYLTLLPENANIIKLSDISNTLSPQNSQSIFTLLSCSAALIDFAEMLYVFDNILNINENSRVLIHASDNNGDLAAAKLALSITPHVVVTYKDSSKHKLLHRMGIQHLLSTDESDVLNKIKTIEPAGFDAIINNASGEFSLKTIGLSKPLGRVVVNNKNTLSQCAASNVQLTYVDLNTLRKNSHEEYQQLLSTAMIQLIDGLWEPPAIQAYSANTIGEAINASWDKAVAVSFEASKDIDSKPEVKNYNSLPEGTYLVTGGFGGFGLKLAPWLAKKGVKNLVMVGRSGAASNTAKQTLALLDSLGVNVMEAKCDISNEAQVASLIAKVNREMPPLVGIFHTAAVLDDAMLNDLTQSRLDKVMAPKARGAWYLHEYTKTLDLKYFIMFSSLSSIVGKPGQSNYVAANAYLDQLANHRQSLGLAGMSLNWGVLAEVGLTAAQGLEDRLEKMGIGSYTADEAMDMLDIIMDIENKQIGLFRTDWKTFSQTTNTPNNSFGLRYEHLIEKEWLNSNVSLGEFLSKLKDLPESDRKACMVASLTEWVANVMRLSEENLDVDTSLNDFGLDSLMAIELQTIIQNQTSIGLSILELIQDNSIDLLSDKLLSRINTLLTEEVTA